MTRDIFGERCSVFLPHPKTGFKDARHFTRTIGQFLEAGKLYAAPIAAIRQDRQDAETAYKRGDVDEYKRLKDRYTEAKSKQPFAVLQGVSPDWKDGNFLSFSNVLTLDLDSPKMGEADNGNGWVTDWEAVKRDLATIPSVAYCSLSAGGKGVFVLVPIADAAHYGEYFDTWVNLLRETKRLTVDEKARNIARLRFMSYDPTPVVNHDAEVWDKIEQGTQHRTRKTQHVPEGDVTLSHIEQERVRLCARYCSSNGVSVAEDYDSWMRLAAFFAHHWDDDEGRELFHDIARQSTKYKAWENDRKLFVMAKHHPTPVGIGTFYWLCKSAGVPIPDDWGGSRRTVSPPMKMRAPRPRQECESVTTPAVTDYEATVSRTITPDPVPVMSDAERMELERNKDKTAEGVAIMRRMLQNVDGFAELCRDFDLQYCGHDITDGQGNVIQSYRLTDAQAYAVSRYTGF